MRENAAYMDSLQAKFTGFKAQFQELILGDGGLSSFVKILTDAGTAILKFANSDIGQLIIKLGLLYASLVLVSKGLAALKTSKIVQGFSSLITAVSSATGFVGKFSAALNSLNINPVVLGITAAVGAFMAIKAIIDAVTVSFEEQKEALEKSKQEYTDSISAVESTQEQLENVKNQIEEINSLEGAKTTREGELENLINQREELEDILAIEQERLRLAQQDYEKKAQELLNATVEDSIFGTSGFASGTMEIIYNTGTREEAIELYAQKLNELNEDIEEHKNKLTSLSREQKGNTEEYKKTEEELRNLETSYDEAMSSAIKYLEELQDETSALDDNSKTKQKVIELEKLLSGAIEEAAENTEDSTEKDEEKSKSLKVLADELETTEKMLQSQARAMGLSYESYAGYLENIESMESEMDWIGELANQLNELTEAYELTADAQYEYSQQGYLSVDTYSQLMQLQPEYLAMMIGESGQLIANADATNFLYQAKVLEMGVSAARAQIDLATSLSDEAGAYSSLGTGAIDASNGIRSLVDAELQLAISKMESEEDISALNAKIDAINDLTQSTMNNVATFTSSYVPINRNTEARNDNTDAIKSQTNALKEQKEALEEERDALESEIDDYETVIDYIKDLLKEEQEALEEQKDSELELIQNKIDAIEKEKEAMEDSIESQIEVLEEKREEEEKYWDDQIDAIQDANDELEENIKLQQLQENLARAKTQKVKVLKNGEFVYDLDEEAISQAEQELSDYEMELSVQKQIEELEKLKEEALNSIDNQINKLEDYRNKQNDNYNKQLEDLKSHYDKVEKEYDERIEQYDEWLKQFEDMLDASSKRHAEILYKELVGEQDNWDSRIKALKNFVSNYEKKKNELDNVKTQIENIDDKIKSLEKSANNSYNNVKSTLGKVEKINNDIEKISNNIDVNSKNISSNFLSDLKNGILNPIGQFIDQIKNSPFVEIPSQMLDQLKKAILGNSDGFFTGKSGSSGFLTGYASGTYSVPEDQIALIADPANSSNREIVVGSKINKGDGILTSLKKGTGIIPSGKNLTENLVNLARWANNSNKTQNLFTKNNSSNSNIINIDNINLPEVKDGNDFIQYILNNFVSDSIQFANIRR